MSNPAEDAVTKYWPIIAGGAVAAWTVFRAWATGRRKDEERDARETAAKLQQRNDLIGIAEEVSGKALLRLQGEVDRQAKRVSELEDEVRELHTAMNVKDAELSLLRGELREWKARADAYEKLLEANNIPHEKPRQPFWRVDAGDSPEAEPQT